MLRFIFSPSELFFSGVWLYSVQDDPPRKPHNTNYFISTRNQGQGLCHDKSGLYGSDPTSNFEVQASAQVNLVYCWPDSEDILITRYCTAFSQKFLFVKMPYTT